MPSWIDRVKTWTGVGFKDPEERVERAMVRVLLLAAAAMVIVGLFDMTQRQSMASIGRVLASLALFAITLWMDRSGRAYPRSVLFLTAITSCAGLIAAAIKDDLSMLINPSPMVAVFATGLLALVLGGKWLRPVAIAWSLMVTVGVGAARWPATQSVGQIVADTATVLILSALAFVAIVAVRHATRQGRVEYERLVELAPVGIVELDLRPVRGWLLQHRLETYEGFRAAVESGELDPRVMARKVVVLGYNAAAGANLFLSKEARVDEIDRGGAQVIADVLARIIYEDEPGTIELSFEAEGKAYHQVMNWSVSHADRRRVVLIATDITAQKDAEYALSNQIRYKNEFVASVSHELRTPLTVVVGLVDELTRLDAVITPVEREELMSIVAEQSHEVAGIVEDLLVAARAAGGNLSTTPVQFDISKNIKSTLQVYRDGFDTDLEDQLTVFADPARVRQIVRNLLTNAVRYGGNNRRVSAFSNGDSTVVEVRDDGPPIPDGIRDAMFEPYERIRTAGQSQPESVGLGLTVARSLAEAMSGRLTYRHDGGDSVFRLTLPARDAQGSIRDRRLDQAAS